VVAAAPTNVTGQVQITFSGFVSSRQSKQYQQSVTIKNTSGSTIDGPIYLVLDNLSSNATLIKAAGTTQNEPPLGSPYIQVTASSLAPGATAVNVLVFSDPSNGAITYIYRVLAGSAHP
jgi:hypothetical protein